MLPHRGSSWFCARSVLEVLLRSRSDEGLELALEIVGSPVTVLLLDHGTVYPYQPLLLLICQGHSLPW